MRGGAVCAEPPALDRAHTLADGVHLDNGCTRCEQVFSERGQLCGRDERLFKEGAPAAREEE